jgi:hypothetical protein
MGAGPRPLPVPRGNIDPMRAAHITGNIFQCLLHLLFRSQNLAPVSSGDGPFGIQLNRRSYRTTGTEPVFGYCQRGPIMSSQPSKPLDSSSWQTQELRLIVFPVQPEAALRRELWQELVGEQPETSVRKRLLRTEEGRIGERVLVMNVDAQRIAWTFVPSIDLSDPPPGIPALGEFSETIEASTSLFERFLTELCPEIRRLAFGAVLFQPNDSHEACYRTLAQYLPAVLVDPQSHDFNYRINRRRKAKSGPESLLINRLSTWSAIIWSAEVRVESPQPRSVLPLTDAYACRLELDINTDPNFHGVLPSGSLVGLWREMVHLGQEIATRGDVV